MSNYYTSAGIKINVDARDAYKELNKMGGTTDKQIGRAHV